MSSPYYRPSAGPGSDYPPDKIWGTIFIVLYALMLAFILLILLGAFAAFNLALTPGAHGTVGPRIVSGAVLGIFSTILVISLGSHIVAAVGVHKSRPWGFWATIILSAISLPSSGGGACLTIVPLVYCILRLTGTLGPKPV